MELDFEMITMCMGLALPGLIAIYMIKQARIKKFEACLEEGQFMTFIDQGYIGLVDDNGHDILYLAAIKGFADIADKALDKGADPNKLYKGKTLLHILARDNHDDTDPALALLKHGALPDGPVGLKITPLWQSAFSDNQDLARLLIDYGADLNFRAQASGTTPLMAAVFQGSVSVGRVLVNEGADLFLFDKKGRQAKDFAHNKDKDINKYFQNLAQAPPPGRIHDYKELIRQINSLMQGKPFEYEPFGQTKHT